ncbi:MAG: hypothetical protein Q7S33_03215 [Nanoarchaeota archaeon]|nr:hypothetical protein [Nanoarchaeota archaeon]
MVKIIDITPDRKKETEQGELELTLAKQCFSGKEIKPSITLPLIRISYCEKEMASKMIGTTKITIYDKSILSQAEEFGRRYEDQFHIPSFTIETDYSEK